MKKILLIEDNEEIRDNTAEILELSNYRVLTAENGKKGVEIAIKEKPDLIICDIMMPILDGYGVLHMIHKIDSLQHTPFIFLTAKTERADIRKGMESGADDYITKPFSGTELLNAVEGRLKKSDLLKETYSTALEGLKQLGQASNNDLLKDLVSDRNINRFKKKQLIYSEGNRPSKLFYIVKGKVKTTKGNDDGKSLVVGLFKEGDFLGYSALFQGCAYKESAEAMEDSELAVIPKEDFDKLIHDNPGIVKKFAQLLASNISEREEQLIHLAYNSLRKKVAEALVTLYRKYHNGDKEKFAIDISRENLAAIAGTATESLIRTLSDFRSEKLIDIHDGTITVLNEKALTNMVN